MSGWNVKQKKKKERNKTLKYVNENFMTLLLTNLMKRSRDINCEFSTFRLICVDLEEGEQMKIKRRNINT